MLHLGMSNQGRTFTLKGRTVESVLQQTVLGIHVHSSLKVASQVVSVVKKGLVCWASSVWELSVEVGYYVSVMEDISEDAHIVLCSLLVTLL